MSQNRKAVMNLNSIGLGILRKAGTAFTLGNKVMTQTELQNILASNNIEA